MSEPVSKTPHRLVASRACLSAARLHGLPGLVAAEERNTEWCLTVEPGRIDRGHLSGDRLRAGPVEQAREKLADAGLSLVLAALAAAGGATPWAPWLGGTAALLALVLPARRVFEAVLVSVPGGQRLRDLRRALGLLGLLAAGILEPNLFAYVPLAFGVLLGAEGALVRATAPRWRLRWSGEEVSCDPLDLQHNDLLVLPPEVPCPAFCRVEQGSARVRTVPHAPPTTVGPGEALPLGAQADGRMVLRVLVVPDDRTTAWKERPTASLRLDQSLRILDIGMLVAGGGLVLAAAAKGSSLVEPLLAAGLAWLVPLGVLQQTGALLVQRTIARFWRLGLHVSSAATLDAWNQVRCVALLPSSLETEGWDDLAVVPEPSLPAWSQVRTSLERGSSEDPAVQVVFGEGLTARLAGDTWIVGTPLFAGATQAAPTIPTEPKTGEAPLALVVVLNGTVIATGTGRRGLRPAARSGVAALEAMGLPLRIVSGPQRGEHLRRRVGARALLTPLPSGPPPAWRVAPWPADGTLWIAATWPEGTPAGPTVRLGGEGQGMLSLRGLQGVAAGLKEARTLCWCLWLLTGMGPLLVAGAMAAGIWAASPLPLLLGSWLGLGLILGFVLWLPAPSEVGALPPR